MTRSLPWSLWLAAVVLGVPGASPAQAPADRPGPVPAPGPAAPAPTGLPQSGDLFESIHVVVGPSARALDPVAVPAARCASGDGVCTEIDAVLQRDLEISGYFKVLDRKSFLVDPAKEPLTQPGFDAWFNIGAKYLVKAEATPGADGFALEFRLFSVADRKGIPVKGQSQSGVPKSGIRRAVHTFVNGVIEAVTGKPGIFGTEIVLSLKGGPMLRSIVAMEMDGSGRRTLVSNGSSNMFPKWGPGGAVLYTSFAPGIPQLYVGGKRLTQDDREYRGAAFSPDGGRIAASVDMGGQSDIVILDPRTGAIQRNLTNSPWDEVTPSWSPDGSQIAYVSAKNGNPQVYVQSSSGGGERRLTMAGAYNTSPAFGPRGVVVFAGMDGYQSDIFTVDLAGNITRLTQDQGSNKDPTWSPDGRYVAFLSNREGGWKLWIMTEDGRYQYPVTDHAGAWATPDWR